MKTEYIGAGAFAEMVEKNRLERKMKRVRELEAEALCKHADEALAPFPAIVDLLVRARLLADGLHRRDKNTWRHRRSQT